MEQAKQRNLYLDIFKIVLAIFVINIHFGNGRFEVLGRFAVPMFFMISGFFLCGKDNLEEKEKSKRFIINSLKYLIIAYALYIAFDIINLLIKHGNISSYIQSLFMGDFIKSFFVLNATITTGYHLWFLVALVVVSLIHFLIIKFNKSKLYYIIVPLGIFMFVFFDGYIRLFNLPALEMQYVRNALFMGLPLVGLGFLVGKFKALQEKSFIKWISLALGLIFFGLQFLERQLYSQAINGYLTSVLCAMFLLIFFIGLPKNRATIYYKYIGASMPYYVYVLHLMVGECLKTLIKAGNIWFVLLVFAISFVIYEVAHLAVLLIKSIIIKKNYKTH